MELTRQFDSSKQRLTQKPDGQIQHAGAEALTLAASGWSKDQQANRKAITNPGANSSRGSPNGNQGLTSYLKVAGEKGRKNAN